MPKRNFWKLILSLVVVALLAYYLMRQGVDAQDMRDALSKFGPGAILGALLFVLLQNFFMALRLWALFPKGRLPFGSVAHGVFYGQLANTFVPARAGDLLKAVVFSKSNVSLLTGAGVIVGDKLVDVSALLLLTLISGAYKIPELDWSAPPPTWTALVVAGVVVIVAVAYRLFLKKALANARSWWHNFRDGLSGLVKPRQVGVALLIGIGAWSFEGIALQILCTVSGIPLGFDRAVFLLFLLNLAIAVPISVANVGTFEAALVFGLGTIGTERAEALAIASIHHVLQLAGIILLSGTVFLIRAWRQGSIKEEIAIEKSEFRVQLEDKMKAIEYFEKVSADYDSTVSKGILRIPRDRERAAVLKFAKLDQPGASLIDVGCGAGFYSLRAKEAGMWVQSVDASPGMVLRLSDKVDFAEVADIEKLESDRKFDRVVCAGVLDFVMRPEVAFRNLCRLVGPGGRLIVLTPRKGLGGLFYRVEKYFFGIRINLYTRHWLQKIAREHGLSLVDWAHPLPTNMALLFEKSAEPIPRPIS